MNAPTGRNSSVSVRERAMAASDFPNSFPMAVNVMTTRKKSNASSVQPRNPATTAARRSSATGRAAVIGVPREWPLDYTGARRPAAPAPVVVFRPRGQNGAARPAVAVINLRFHGEHANVLQPGDTAVVAAATSKLRATLGASDVVTIVDSSATATAVAQAEADGNPCDNACARAVARRLGARWVAKGTISNLSNLVWLLSADLQIG